MKALVKVIVVPMFALVLFYGSTIDVNATKKVKAEDGVKMTLQKLIKTDATLKRMKIIWIRRISGTKEIQAWVAPAKNRFPGWYFRFSQQGNRVLGKEKLYGE